MPPPTQKSFIDDYYKTMGFKKIPKRGDVSCLKHQELYQLYYKTPKKDAKGKSMPQAYRQR